MSMANPAFWPEKTVLRTAQRGTASSFKHSDAVTRNGVHIRNRTIELDSTTYEVCFLLLDVQWDLAASIILHEAGIFKPDLVIMSGMNGREPLALYFETGAVNEATLSSGFSSDGRRVANNLPAGQDTRVLQNLPADQRMLMTWNAIDLAAATGSVVVSISRDVKYTSVSAGIRTSNDYICNNVSYAVTAGLTGNDIKLAGGLISIPGQNTGTKVGFIHYPYESSAAGRADNPEQVFGWNKVLATVFRSELP